MASQATPAERPSAYPARPRPDGHEPWQGEQDEDNGTRVDGAGEPPPPVRMHILRIHYAADSVRS